jgi:general secretion pathway protein K
VLWVLALLAVVIVGFTSDARTELLLARNHYASASARAIADTGVSFAILGITDPSPQTQWHADGRARELSYGGGSIRVAVQDEAGKIDLNFAPPELLAGLLKTLGLADNEAAGIAQSIDRWRRAHGSDSDAQSGAVSGLPRRQQDEAFRAIEELRLVPGVTRSLYDRMAPFITVYSGVPDIDPLTAPAEVLRSLPGANPQEIETFLAERERLGPEPGALPPLSGVTGYLVHRGLQAVMIISEGKIVGGTTFTREVVVALAPDPSAPYSVLTWRPARRPLRGTQAPPAESE